MELADWLIPDVHGSNFIYIEEHINPQIHDPTIESSSVLLLPRLGCYYTVLVDVRLFDRSNFGQLLPFCHVVCAVAVFINDPSTTWQRYTNE